MKKGFTLIETIIVLALIGILLSIAVPQFSNSRTRAREAVLKENLFQIRDCIQKYFYDKKKYPTQLEDLVNSRYLMRVPVDPITKQADWEIKYYEPLEGEEYDPEMAQAIVDVRSRSEATALDGSSYNTW